MFFTFARYPNQEKNLNEWYKNHKGIKWIFRDKRYEYWKFVGNIIYEYIKSNGTLYGIKII